MRTDLMGYLQTNGIDVATPDSPHILSMLQEHFDNHHFVAHFDSLTEAERQKLIQEGHDALIEALAEQHQQTGKLEDEVARVIEMPFIVGGDPIVPRHAVDPTRMFKLMEAPGTNHERLVWLMATNEGAIPSTSKATVTGGLYADGHTAGYLHIFAASQPLSDQVAVMATPSQIYTMAGLMQDELDQLPPEHRMKYEKMIARVHERMPHLGLVGGELPDDIFDFAGHYDFA